MSDSKYYINLKLQVVEQDLPNPEDNIEITAEQYEQFRIAMSLNYYVYLKNNELNISAQSNVFGDKKFDLETERWID